MTASAGHGAALTVATIASQFAPTRINLMVPGTTFAIATARICDVSLPEIVNNVKTLPYIKGNINSLMNSCSLTCVQVIFACWLYENTEES